MAQPRTPSSATEACAADEGSRGDPWHAFSYLVAGVGLYALLGWGLDRLLGTTWLVAVGIVFGAVLGLYLTWARFMTPRPERTLTTDQTPQTSSTTQTSETDQTRQEAS